MVLFAKSEGWVGGRQRSTRFLDDCAARRRSAIARKGPGLDCFPLPGSVGLETGILVGRRFLGPPLWQDPPRFEFAASTSLQSQALRQFVLSQICFRPLRIVSWTRFLKFRGMACQSFACARRRLSGGIARANVKTRQYENTIDHSVRAKSRLANSQTDRPWTDCENIQIDPALHRMPAS